MWLMECKNKLNDFQIWPGNVLIDYYKLKLISEAHKQLIII